MNTARVDGIVNAVLYEGYMLYPYRPSAIKNRQRFNFGVVYPRAYSEAQRGADAWTMQTECLVTGNQNTHCEVRVRFLRMVDRTLDKVRTPFSELSQIAEENIEKVDRLEVNGRGFQAWQEATEEEIDVAEFNLSAVVTHTIKQSFRFPATQDREAIRDEHGLIAGFFNRHKANIAGRIEVAAEHVRDGVFKLTIRVLNDSQIELPIHREHALARSLVSTHTILGVRDGEFVSLVDPPDTYRDLVRTCQNIGTWPVLVGENGQGDTLLSSPIILYDYPQIAPESPGDLFDGAEIDEILSLRIMTLTDEEKREMRQSDERARQLLDRTEGLLDEQLIKLHGALRGMRNIRSETP